MFLEFTDNHLFDSGRHETYFIRFNFKPSSIIVKVGSMVMNR
ncbi:hypothetical protein BH11VER1_BH11VER1_36710 [soil metagenome]